MIPLQRSHVAAFGHAERCDDVARHALDRLTTSVSSHESFAALVTAPGDYRPTLRAGGATGALAKAYDAHQAAVGDPRRAEVRS